VTARYKPGDKVRITIDATVTHADDVDMVVDYAAGGAAPGVYDGEQVVITHAADSVTVLPGSAATEIERLRAAAQRALDSIAAGEPVVPWEGVKARLGGAS
jgi:hypothetical protein